MHIFLPKCPRPSCSVNGVYKLFIGAHTCLHYTGASMFSNEKYKTPFYTGTRTRRGKNVQPFLCFLVTLPTVLQCWPFAKQSSFRPFLPTQTDAWEGPFSPSFCSAKYFSLQLNLILSFLGGKGKKAKHPFCEPGLIDWKEVFPPLSPFVKHSTFVEKEKNYEKTISTSSDAKRPVGARVSRNLTLSLVLPQ